MLSSFHSRGIVHEARATKALLYHHQHHEIKCDLIKMQTY